MSSITPEPKKRFGKGILLIAVGATLLLHTLGLFQYILTVLIIIASLAMIAYGMILTHAYRTIVNFCTSLYTMFQKNK